MKRRGLKALIRLHRYLLDEKRREVADRQAIHRELVADYLGIEQEIVREQALARSDPAAATTYGAYAREVVRRRSELAGNIDTADQAVEAARDETREQFREAKKFELAEEHIAAEEHSEQERKDRIDHDELAVGLYRRQHE